MCFLCNFNKLWIFCCNFAVIEKKGFADYMGIKRIWARIKRIGKGRGFGIQSPADYNFVCNVINEHLPYYAYSELKKQLPNLTSLQRSKCELLFRIANFLQPQVTINIGMPQCFEKYVLRGCMKTTIHNIYNNVSGKCRLLILAPSDSLFPSEEREKILHLLQHGNCLVVDNINDSEQTRSAWQALIADSRCTVCFDLYDMGIIIADNKRDKAFYAINY